MAADDDDLARLMKEIEDFDRASGHAPAGQPAAAQSAPSGEVAKRSDQVAERGSGSRGKWAAIAAVGAGVAGFLVGSVLWFLPYVNGPSMALGSALGAAIVAFLSGPPRWLR